MPSKTADYAKWGNARLPPDGKSVPHDSSTQPIGPVDNAIVVRPGVERAVHDKYRRLPRPTRRVVELVAEAVAAGQSWRVAAGSRFVLSRAPDEAIAGVRIARRARRADVIVSPDAGTDSNVRDASGMTWKGR